MTLSIIIPVYNEKETILKVLKKIETVSLREISFKKEIIIVNDGSNDGTREVLNKLTKNYRIIHHSKNQGKGLAIRTGIKYISGDYVIIQDADLEYDPEDYKRILECVLRNKAKVVYGSRELNAKNKSSYFFYHLGGIFLTRVANFIYGIKITDEATCYKLFETEIIKNIPLKCKRFEFCPEITAKIAKKGIKIYEVPINYYPRTKEEGKKIRWIDGLYAFWILIKYRMVN